MEFVLEPGEAIRHTDVLNAAFGVPDGTDAFGALAVLSDSDNLYLYSRTYTMRSSRATYGQGIPGYPMSALIPAETRKRLMFVTENQSFRSNIALLNGVGSPITVMWQRFNAAGVMVDEGSAELPVWGTTQINKVFEAEAPVEAAYIDVWTETPDAVFLAWGSVLDNTTSDPATIFPQ